MSKAFRQAQEAYRAGRATEAANTLREALRQRPDHAPSFHLLGNIEVKQGRLPVALKCFEAAVGIDPGNAKYQVDRANVIASMGQPVEAIAAFEVALKLNPRLAEAHSNRAQALRMLGRRREALEGYSAAVALKPDFVDAYCFMGETLMDLKDYEAAIRAFTQALLHNPTHISVLINRSACHANLQRHDKALKDLDLVIKLVPDHSIAQSRRSQFLFELDQFGPALVAAERALAVNPLDGEAQLRRGRALSKLERCDEALMAIERAMELGADKASCFVARGANFAELRQFDKALEDYDRGIRINPANSVWFYNRGSLLQNLRRYEEALISFDEAIAREPNHAPAYWNAGLTHLTLGNPKGWDYYEWRWRLGKGGPDKRTLPKEIPRWHGFESLELKRILLVAEQGLGDSIMFCRYATLVAERGAEVTLAVPKGLVRMLAGVQGLANIVPRDEPRILARFDYYCPLLSLPKIFATTFDRVPFGDRPYLSADPTLVALWRERLAAAGCDGSRPRVGLMWSGRATKALGLRSMSLATMLGVMDPGYQYVSLQKDIPSEDKDLLRERGVPHFGDEQEDFADAAAIIELCDLVISIDTSIAHLAGALGKETWVALQFNSEWRWLLDRDDSPWYPRARLFRQPRQDDWEAVTAKIAEALRARPTARAA